MIVELNHRDLVCLVRGVYPPRELVKHLEDVGLGTYSGSHDEWRWNGSLSSIWAQIDAAALWDLYQKLVAVDEQA